MAQTSADPVCLPDSTVSTSNSSAASDTVHEGDALYDSEARSLLLQQALFQAAAVRAQQQAVKASANSCSGMDQKSNVFQHNQLGLVFNGAIGHDAAEEERQKIAIQSHPLFPVLEALLLKCEDATWNMSDKSVDLDDVVQILKRLEAEGRPVRTGDDELDRLVRDSILVLRMNLVELAKVADLCDDFRTRYVQCIKRKMNQETLLGFGNESDDESMNGDGRCSPGTSNRGRGAVATLTTAQGTVSVPLEIYAASNGARTDQEIANDAMSANFPTNGHFSFDDDAFNFEHRGPGRKSSLPKKAVDVLKGWLFQHVTHPYPTELEKSQLSHDTSLSLSQVNNWFINARRRILQPMLDGPCNEWSQSVTVPKNKKQRLSTASSPETQCSPLSETAIAASAAETTREHGTGSSPDSRSSSNTPTS